MVGRAKMGTMEVYEQKLRSGNLRHDPTMLPGLGSPLSALPPLSLPPRPPGEEGRDDRSGLQRFCCRGWSWNWYNAQCILWSQHRTSLLTEPS
ncbi:hypothetical protein MLD38_033169 [Melastoma candidum]|uniref:Uncharacterized protein n=1 Tax=Melastoma candidum TaxID=119954 RepID=A0ACB9M7Q1_9MYRT|nr:hypothetical protein MLD38_033169 [Melastoma candidum]